MNKLRTNRRWLQFTLRAALLVMLVVAAFLGGRASMYSRLERERRQAERTITSLEARLAQPEMQRAWADTVARRLLMLGSKGTYETWKARAGNDE